VRFSNSLKGEEVGIAGHPGGQRAHFVEGDIGGKANAAFAGAAGDGMLDAIAGEDFQATIVKLDGNVDGDFLGGGAEDFAQTVVQVEAGGGLVKASFGGQPWVLLLLERQRGAC
jgi:hypothetical protein